MAGGKGGTPPYGVRRLDLDAVSSGTAVDTQLLGRLELRPLSLDDLVWVAELAQDERDDRAYVATVLHHQLSRPTVTLPVFSRLPDDEIISIARDYAEQQDLSQYLPNGPGIESFADVKHLLEASLEAMIEELRTALVEVVSASLAGALASLRSMWDELGERFAILEEDAVPALLRYKWFVTPSLPLYLVAQAARIGALPGNQRGAMNKLFAGYFGAGHFSNLRVLVEGWSENPLFHPRMKILTDCVSALACENGRFNASNVVLPPLLAQIDGISTELMLAWGFRHSGSGGFRDVEGRTVGKAQGFKARADGQWLVHSANDIFLNVLLQKAFPGQPLQRPFTFSRHKIMHGEQLRYGRLDNSIRAFLVLDFLASLSDEGSAMRRDRGQR